MRSKDDIKELLGSIQNTEDKPVQFDEEAIVSAYQKGNENQSLSIKILSVVGGILGSHAFLGFLYVAGLFNSDVALLVFGGIFIAGSIWINKKYDKIIIDTVSVSSFNIGLILIGYGCWQLYRDENIINIICITIAFSSLCIIRNFILSFVSVLIINGSIFMLFISNKVYDLIPIYVSVLALTLTYFFLKEATIITTNKALSKLYNPVRIGLIFSLLSVLSILGQKGILPESPNYIWLPSVIIISVIVYLISVLFDVLNITETRHKIGIYIFTVLALSPTALSPTISGALLIILLSFLVNHKTGLALGIVSFIAFISQYYYNLNFTLLTKSILLFSTGVLFIAFYLFTYKKLAANEKV